MTSFIIVSSDRTKREEYIQAFCKERHIDPFDITTLSVEKEEKGKKTVAKQSIGIEEVKKFQEKIFLKPLRSPEKVIVIDDAQLVTIEAQNALLKLLEEPPLHTLIMLSVDSVETILGTILSRCKVISLDTERKEIAEEKKEEARTVIDAFSTFSVARALMLAEKYAKSKSDALTFLETLILLLREKYLTEESKDNFHIIKPLQETHTLIKTTNVNIRMALEKTFLAFVS